MCGKQCRDENGFKCHLTSESHKRQMEVFGQNPHRVIDGFSEEFEATFLEHLRRTHPFSRASANVVYNEFIHDRNHIHMNATKWLTLTEFVKYLGRTGKCKVEDTPKGWYITLIQKDPFEELGEKKRSKRERAEREEEERHQKALEQQIERAQRAALSLGAELRGDDGTTVPPEGPLGFSLAGDGGGDSHRPVPAVAFDDVDEGVDLGNAPVLGHQQKKTKLELLIEKDMMAKQRQSTAQAAAAGGNGQKSLAGEDRKTAPWLAKGIVVKVLSKALKEHGYYKQKGLVTKVIDSFIGEIEMLGSGDIVRVDQAELETVVPQPGGSVLVVSGPWQGRRGTLLSITEADYSAEVSVEDGTRSDPDATKIVRLEYEEFSKFK